VRSADGKIEKVRVRLLPGFKEKLKGYIHWVSKDHAAEAVVRLYNRLFTVKEVPNDDWEKFINPASLDEKRNAKVWAHVAAKAKEFDRFQFERNAFFCVDRDSGTEAVGGKIVFNRIVELKESKEKKVNLGK
jgi:glutaminyl-tRNA synthetase